MQGLISRVVSTIEGTACEIEYIDSAGNVVGYWAYGSFDPAYPYQGGSANSVSGCGKDTKDDVFGGVIDVR